MSGRQCTRGDRLRRSDIRAFFEREPRLSKFTWVGHRCFSFNGLMRRGKLARLQTGVESGDGAILRCTKAAMVAGRGAHREFKEV